MNVVNANFQEEFNDSNLEGSLEGASNVPCNGHCRHGGKEAPTDSFEQ